jgi:hypothetical protein
MHNDYCLTNHNDDSALNASFLFYLWRDLLAIEKNEWLSVFAMLGVMARWKDWRQVGSHAEHW